MLSEGAAVAADRSFAALITSQVDFVLAARQQMDEQAEAEAINAGR